MFILFTSFSVIHMTLRSNLITNIKPLPLWGNLSLIPHLSNKSFKCHVSPRYSLGNCQVTFNFAVRWELVTYTIEILYFCFRNLFSPFLLNCLNFQKITYRLQLTTTWLAKKVPDIPARPFPVLLHSFHLLTKLMGVLKKSSHI